MCAPNDYRPWSINDAPYYRGNKAGKIAGSLSAMSIVGALYAAGSIPFPGMCVVLLGLSSGGMGYLTGGEAGARLSQMWYSQNSGGGIGSIPGILGGMISLGPPIAMLYYSGLLGSKPENPDELTVNNTKFIITNLPAGLLESEAVNNIDCAGTTPDVPEEAVEGY